LVRITEESLKVAREMGMVVRWKVLMRATIGAET